MSGTDTTVNETAGATPDAVNPTPSATPVSAQPAPQGAASMLSQGKWAGVIAIMGMATVCVVILLGVSAMAYRVFMDGNSPLTADLSGKLAMITIGGFAAIVAALFGSNQLISKLMEKLL